MAHNIFTKLCLQVVTQGMPRSRCGYFLNFYFENQNKNKKSEFFFHFLRKESTICKFHLKLNIVLKVRNCATFSKIKQDP